MSGVVFYSSRRRHTRCALVTGVHNVCSSDLPLPIALVWGSRSQVGCVVVIRFRFSGVGGRDWHGSTSRSEEHTSELQSLMRISYAVFCLKKKKKKSQQTQ